MSKQKSQPRPEEKETGANSSSKSKESSSQNGEDCLKLGCLIVSVTFGLIILGLIILAGYVWLANPYNMKDWIMSPEQQAQEVIGEAASSTTSISSSTAENLPLNEKQLNQLQKAGVDLDKLKNKDPKELQNCAQNKVGEDKLKQIMSGQTQPSLSEMMGLRECLN